jgi:hypothetical protein
MINIYLDECTALAHETPATIELRSNFTSRIKGAITMGWESRVNKSKEFRESIKKLKEEQKEQAIKARKIMLKLKK